MSPDFRRLNNEQLDFALRQIDLRLAALKDPGTAMGKALEEQFRARREAALAEQRRRRRAQ